MQVWISPSFPNLTCGRCNLTRRIFRSPVGDQRRSRVSSKPRGIFNDSQLRCCCPQSLKVFSRRLTHRGFEDRNE
jgi:hypothetical protein